MSDYRTVIGLDIGHHTVKVVRADRRGKSIAFGKPELMRLPSEAGDKAAVVARWLGDLGLLKYPCVLGLPGQSTMFQPLTVAANDPRTFEQIASVEISRFNELASETTVYGFSPILTDSGEKRLLIAMARPAVLDSILRPLQAVGLEIVDLVPAPVALYAASEYLGLGSPEPYICADIGSTATEVAVGSHTGLMFARSFAAGGQLFTDTVAKALGVPFRQAETAKESTGALFGGDDLQRPALVKAAGTWTAEFGVCLSVLRNLFKADRDQPRRVLLSGGGSELSAFVPYLRDELRLNVSDTRDLEPNHPLLASSRFLIAAGLAVTGMGMAKTSISLLPASLRDELLLRRQKRYWIGAAACAGLVLAVSLLGGYREFRRMEVQLNEQRDSLRRCQDLARKIDQIKTQNDLILGITEPVKAMLSTGPLVRDLASRVAKAKDADDWITTLSDGESYFAPRSTTTPEPAPPPADQLRPFLPGDPAAARSSFARVIIEGYTAKQDLTSVKTLISALRSIPYVKSADLLSDDQVVKDPERERKWTGTGRRRFVIDLRTAKQ